MAMTEKQGGSDVRANTTRAVAENGGGPGARYRLTGHKWFCSAPMSDAFLMLAQAPGGLSCFFVPRRRDDGTLNGIEIQRLKDKLGNRSNASSEIELDDAEGRLVGDEGRGRPDDHPDGEPHAPRLRARRRVGHAPSRRPGDAPRRAPARVRPRAHRPAVDAQRPRRPRGRERGRDDAGDPARRARTTRPIGPTPTPTRSPSPGSPPRWQVLGVQAPARPVAEALECLGGNGYVEESIMPRLFRESPLNGIWEGSGNVICLDVLRAMGRAAGVGRRVPRGVLAASGTDRALRRPLRGVSTRPRGPRRPRVACSVDRRAMALALQASLLIRAGSDGRRRRVLRLAPRSRGALGWPTGRCRRASTSAAIIGRARPSLR